MTKQDVAAYIRSVMPPQLCSKPGAVLINGASNLKPGTVYVMGLNPGGHPERIPRPLIESIAPLDGTSTYTHECWQPRCFEPQPCRHLESDGTTRPEFLVRHQRNMIALASALRSTPSALFATNAIFARSTARATLRAQTGLGLWEWWSACWPVHQWFLSIVRPRLILTLGYGENSSAFGLLRAQSGSPEPIAMTSEGRRGGWQFAARLDLGRHGILDATVAGVPHPSYFAIGPQLSLRLGQIAGDAPRG